MRKSLQVTLLIFLSIPVSAQQTIKSSIYDNCKSIYLFNFTDGKNGGDRNTIEFTKYVREELVHIRECTIAKGFLPIKGHKRSEPIVNNNRDVSKYMHDLDRVKAKTVLLGTVTHKSRYETTFRMELYELKPFRMLGAFTHIFTDNELNNDDIKRSILKNMVEELVYDNRYGLSDARNIIEKLEYIRPVVLLNNDTIGESELRKGVSRNGKDGYFRLMYITDEKQWKFGSSTSLDEGSLNDVLETDLPNFPEYKEAVGLIAVGVASQEGEEIEEVGRAERRAAELVYQLKRSKARGKKELYKLNLGQHTVSAEDTSRDQTSYQRRVIVIGIVRRNTTMDEQELEEALKDALSKSGVLKFDRNKYSKFVFERKN